MLHSLWYLQTLFSNFLQGRPTTVALQAKLNTLADAVQANTEAIGEHNTALDTVNGDIDEINSELSDISTCEVSTSTGTFLADVGKTVAIVADFVGAGDYIKSDGETPIEMGTWKDSVDANLTAHAEQLDLLDQNYLDALRRIGQSERRIEQIEFCTLASFKESLFALLEPVGTVRLFTTWSAMMDCESIKHGRWSQRFGDVPIGPTFNGSDVSLEEKHSGLIELDHLPNHAHKGLLTDDSIEPTGSGAGYARRAVRSHTSTAYEGNVNMTAYTGMLVGSVNQDVVQFNWKANQYKPYKARYFAYIIMEKIAV